MGGGAGEDGQILYIVTPPPTLACIPSTAPLNDPEL